MLLIMISLFLPKQLCHLQLKDFSVWCPALCLEDILGYTRYVGFAASLYVSNSILLLKDGGVVSLETCFVQGRVSCKNAQ